MEQISIPILNMEKMEEKSYHDQMELLVEQMLELQQKLQDAGDNREKESLSEEIQQLDQRIDRRVYRLYGLTEEEIAIVEREIGGK
jgi:GTPase SAR1 family protein